MTFNNANLQRLGRFSDIKDKSQKNDREVVMGSSSIIIFVYTHEEFLLT